MRGWWWDAGCHGAARLPRVQPDLHTAPTPCVPVPPAYPGHVAPPALPRRPCILIGSAFGAALSLVLLQVLPSALDLQPGVYAVVGATAMLGATFRSSISLVVIVVEGTRGIGAPGQLVGHVGRAARA